MAKLPSTVPTKDVVYWVIILAAIVGSFIGGFQTHIQLENDAKARANEMLTSLTVKKAEQ